MATISSKGIQQIEKMEKRLSAQIRQERPLFHMQKAPTQDYAEFSTKAPTSSGATIGERIFGVLTSFSQGIADTGLTTNIVNRAKSFARGQAKEAHGVLGQVENFFREYLSSYGLDDSVEFFIRAKSLDGAEVKIGNEFKKRFSSFEEKAKELTKFDVEDILPKPRKDASVRSKKMYAQTKEMLLHHSEDGKIDFQKLNEVLTPEKLEKTYGKVGVGFHNRIRERVRSLSSGKKAALKIKELLRQKRNISGAAQNPKNIAEDFRDAIGVRFVMKKPDADKINALPENERLQAIEKFKRSQMDRITAMLMEICGTSETKMDRVRIYGRKNTYLSEKNLQRFKTLDGVEVRNENQPSGYITTQGNLVMKVQQKGKQIPVNVEFQIRGEETNKFAEVEHIPYDLRQGKPIHYNKYSKEQKLTLVKIQNEVKKFKTNKSLKDAYNKYLEDWYNYYFAKENGVSLAKPQLPKGLDDVLSHDSLMTLQH